MKFQEEERVADLAAFFCLLAVSISCLGLFGLASYVAEQRTKEIGIRKVLGASVANLWSLLSKDFALLVMASCIVAIPIAYTVLDGWLDTYELSKGFIGLCVYHHLTQMLDAILPLLLLL